MPETVSNKQLLKVYFAAKDLRSWQKNYFRTRSPYVFKECKLKEKQLDKLIDALNIPELSNPTPVQKSLF